MMRLLVILCALAILRSTFGVHLAHALPPAPIPQTGQANCYDASGITASCTGTGQDGEVRMGVAWPNPRFVDNGDQTVTDHLTGLIWSKDANAAGGTKTWQQALDYLKTLNSQNYLGHNDWHLPNRNEMASLLNTGQASSAAWLNSIGFTNVQEAPSYWSSTTSSEDTSSAWHIRMNPGYIKYYSKTFNYYVWPVRSGQQLPGYVPIAQTGQTKCYDAVGTAIACAGTGQDGELLKGIAWPNPRFMKNGDGTITDNLTGLTWVNDLSTPGIGTGVVTFKIVESSSSVNEYCQAGPTTWQGAFVYVKCLNDLNYLGHNDWRLPNRNEMASLTTLGGTTPVDWLNSMGFSNALDSAPWTSSSSVQNPAEAWTGFYSPVNINKQLIELVVPVRGPSTSIVPSYAISSSTTGAGGSISCVTPVAQGAASTCTISTGTGYSLATLTDNGANVKSRVTGTTYGIANISAGHTVIATFGDTAAPVITAFTLPASASTLTVPVSAFTATDNAGVTGFLISESATAPSANAIGWSATVPTGYSFASAGAKTLYAFAKDAAGNVSAGASAAVTVTVPGPTNIIVNPDFESGATGWVSYNSYFANDIYQGTGQGNNGSNWFAWMGYYDNFSNSLYQDVTIPSNSTKAALTFHYYITTKETTSGPVKDMMQVELVDPTTGSSITTLKLLSNLDKTAGWVTSQTFDLTSYKGRTVRLRFSATTDAQNRTNFLIDDVALTVAAPTAGTPSLQISAFGVPSTSASLTIPITTFTAADGTGVTGYMVTESPVAPSASDLGWSATAPTSYTFAGYGYKTLYAWVKNAAGSVLADKNATVTATFSETALQSIGPRGGAVNALVIDPTLQNNGQILHAGSVNGLYRSTNGGASWTAASGMPGNINVTSLGIAQSNSQYVYAGTWSGLFRSTDSGASWTATGGSWIDSLAIDPTDNKTLYAGGQLGIFKTSDAGTSWTKADDGITSTDITCLVIDPTKNQTVYAGTTGGGIFRSTDGGTSWTAINSGINGTDVTSLLIDSTNPQKLYAGTPGYGLFGSKDGGASWASVTGVPGFYFVNSLAIDPTGQNVYAGSAGNMSRSTNGGQSWTTVNDAMSNTVIYSLIVDPTNSQTVYAGTFSAVLKSTDSGVSWKSAASGLTPVIASVVMDPTDTRTVYAGTSGNKIFKSTDSGSSWTAFNNGLNSLSFYSMAIDPKTRTVYAGAVDGLYKFSNGGTSWTALTGIGDSVNSIAIDPSPNSQTIYAGTYSKGIFKTRDGTTWTTANSGMTDTNISSILIDPTSSGQTLYAGTVFGSTGLFKSLNGGASWTVSNKGLTSTDVQSLAIDPVNNQILFAGTYDGLFKSTDGAASWIAANGGLPENDKSVLSLAIDPTNSRTVYAGLAGGLFKSDNGGASWSAVNDGIPAGSIINSLAIDSTDSKTLYAGTNGGVFKTLLSNNVPALTGAETATFGEGVSDSFRVAATGWPAPVFGVSGTLPSGVSFDASTGTLSGVPVAGSAGNYPLIVTAGNGIPPDATRALTLTVLPPTALGISITAPSNNAKTGSLASITGTASGSGLAKVEAQVSDGSYYLQTDGSFNATPAWLTATGTASWSLNTSSVAWREGFTYNVLARASGGSATSMPASSNFTLQVPASKTATIVSMTFAPEMHRAGDSTTISGALVTADAVAVSGQTVTLIITPPSSTATPDPAPIVTTLSTDSNGNFTSGVLSQFAVAGVYLVQVRYNGTSTLAASSTSRALGVTPQSGYAIIVTGEATDLSLLAMHTATTDAIYSTLVNKRGFLPGNVSYLQSTTSAAVTMQQVQSAITSWARDKIAAVPAPLYLFMVDHGSNTGFMLGGQTIAPTDLAGWLNTLESDPQVVTSGALSAYNRFIIIGSCYSGEFVSLLSKPGRVIVTSAGADEQSLAGFSIYNSATSTTFSGGEYFIDNMTNFLGRGDSIKDAVLQASSNVTLRDPRKVALGQHSGVYDTLAQHPLLDDNGDGIAGYLPAGGTDGALAAGLSLGVGIRSLGEPADITAVTGTAIIASTQTGDAPLWLRVNDNSRIAKAWMEIRTPITSVSSSGGTGQVIPHLLTMPLYYDGLQWNSSYNFPNAGTYNILYYTQDNQTGDISPTAHSTVYKQLTNNTAPSSFSLSSPLDQQGVSPMFPLTWQEVTSNNSVTYTLLVATDQNFGSIVYKEESIPQATTYIADGKLKNPANNAYYCQNGDSYCYWKVQAIDSYGTVTESNFRSFTVVASNGLPALLKGYVRSSATGAPIAGAQVVTGSGTVSTLSNGFYLSSVFASSVNLSVSAPGYLPKTLSNVSTPAASVVSNDFNLSPSGVAGKPGDCDGNSTVTIAEVQSAINMFLGLKPVQGCVDLDNSGVVTISEVQKVINSFLGL